MRDGGAAGSDAQGTAAETQTYRKDFSLTLHLLDRGRSVYSVTREQTGGEGTDLSNKLENRTCLIV